MGIENDLKAAFDDPLSETDATFALGSLSCTRAEMLNFINRWERIYLTCTKNNEIEV
jgi:hypothetical protein